MIWSDIFVCVFKRGIRVFFGWVGLRNLFFVICEEFVLVMMFYIFVKIEIEMLDW